MTRDNLRNYTVYSTEDLRSIIEALVLCVPESPPMPLVVVYWQGQREASHLNVRRNCAFDPERKGYALRIKRPDKLNISGIEMLSMQGEEARLPEPIVREVLFALSRVPSVLGGQSPRLHGYQFEWEKVPVIRLQASPDLVETKEEKWTRVRAKKVRKAVTAATSNGLRMGHAAHSLRERVAEMEAFQHLLGEEEKLLLSALKAQLISTLAVLELARNLQQRGE